MINVNRITSRVYRWATGRATTNTGRHGIAVLGMMRPTVVGWTVVGDKVVGPLVVGRPGVGTDDLSVRGGVVASNTTGDMRIIVVLINNALGREAMICNAEVVVAEKDRRRNVRPMLLLLLLLTLLLLCTAVKISVHRNAETLPMLNISRRECLLGPRRSSRAGPTSQIVGILWRGKGIGPEGTTVLSNVVGVRGHVRSDTTKTSLRGGGGPTLPTPTHRSSLHGTRLYGPV